jgi:hypothetical protein
LSANRFNVQRARPRGADEQASAISFEPEETPALYVDGHVRVYHGKTKQLPKHYVARERLCLSATVDYWVNAMDGKPIFYGEPSC